jgi:kinesin family protein 6/9
VSGSADQCLPYNVYEDTGVLEILVPRNPSAGHVNNQREAYEFRFKDVFDQNSQQEDVFDKVAKPLTLSCMDGYNGTIFAYGQTGSGKTYTMCGADSWSLRGIIPRVFSLIFEELEARSNIDYNVYVTFMEIYNESAYDLLDSAHAEQSMDTWTKIQLYEDQYGNLHMKNLSIHQVRSEQDGIDLLMMGNFIRQVSSTPMNLASSRSHCIFTVAFESREPGSEIIRSSKLHLVDLAGSERISKSQISGKTLVEAKHINLSLTYLEQVIISLHERETDQRTHIPYRNSLMTTILRDSLGGNCKTVLIATMNSEIEQLEESISTARFAFRCSKLTVEVTINEQVDINIMVQRLKIENSQLKEQLAGMSQDSRLSQSISISSQDSELCKKQVAMFLSPAAQPQLIVSAIQISTKAQTFRCLQLFREAMRIKEERYLEEIRHLQEREA